jgi:uncharacterized OB-fold protein
MPSRLLPIRDRDSAEYWSWLERRELRLQRCADCGTFRWPARVICGACLSERAGWERLSGRGTLVSWIRVHHATVGWYRAHVPYVVVTVALEEQADCVIPANLVGTDAAAWVGQPVQAEFEDVGDDRDERATLLQWRPAGPLHRGR